MNTNEMENTQVGNVSESEQVGTTTTNEEVATDQQANENTAVDNDVAKSFTQEQVNDLVRERIERERNSVFSRYGVKDRYELDDLIGKAQSYDVMKERYGNIKTDLQKLNEEMAFLENNVNPERKDDVYAYFKGKGLDFTREAMKQEITTHPEWLKVIEKSDKPVTTIEAISPERTRTHIVNEKEEMAKLFGLDKLL